MLTSILCIAIQNNNGISLPNVPSTVANHPPFPNMCHFRATEMELCQLVVVG